MENCPDFEVKCCVKSHGLRIGRLSNHDESDDDDVKYARRDWDENVIFGGKMKLRQRVCSRTTTNEFLSDSLRI